MDVPGGIMSNATLPPLPAYTLRPLEPLIPGLPDTWFQAILLIVAYWGVSGFFHIIDVYELAEDYRLHTPEEVKKRNRVSRMDVFKAVLMQQFVQTGFALVLGVLDPPAMTGKNHYDIAVWARRLRMAQQALPTMLGFVGVNSLGLANKLSASYPTVSSILAGGAYDNLQFDPLTKTQVPAFASWEILAANTIYHVIVPAIQFLAGIIIVDTWQYFWHRAMHMNRWLYVNWHSRHHQLYIPYAYGALYNTLVEGFVLDTLGAGVAYLLTGMTCRQAMWFFTCSTIKTVDDHCGYALPFDPLQHLTSNNATYHDVHHQSWGIKSNFSQPFFTFWDRLFDTKFKGDTSLRYERDRKTLARREELANQKLEASEDRVEIKQEEETVMQTIELAPPFEGEDAGMSATDEAPRTEGRILRRSPRKKSIPSTTPTSGSFAAPIKELRSRMKSSMHGRASGVMMESGH